MYSDKRRETEPGVPGELKALRQWVVWRYEMRPGKDKPAKRPYSPRTGRPARTDVPATWGTWPQALARNAHGGWDGLGFVFSASDPYGGIDLDGCRDPETEVIASWAWQIVEQMQSYTEISVSGRGLHILVRAALSDHSGRKRGAVEIYDHQRYFAVTGERLVGTPALLLERQVEVLAQYATLAREEPESLPAAARPRPTLSRPDAEVVAKALAAANGATFQALYSRNLAAYTDPRTGKPDHSRADFALCLLLAYWCNSDPEPDGSPLSPIGAVSPQVGCADIGWRAQLWTGRAIRLLGNWLVAAGSEQQGQPALTTDYPMLGVIPSPPGNGGTAHPQSSDWTSISEAG